jgi:hypothetical protein
MNKIGIVIIATNAYFILGINLIKKFIHYYEGDSEITFYFFSDTDPKEYLAEDIDVKYTHQVHNNWVDGTNSKFNNIISLENCNSNYLYYFDADTNISKKFNEDWFLGNIVGGEHYGNRSWLSNGAGFDKNKKSKAYVDPNSKLSKTYYYGAFFGGNKESVINFCKTLREWQLEDKKIPYEPGVNDESYINAYFHYNPPTLTVPTEKFMFDISDKGGIENTRNTNLDISSMKKELKNNKEKLFSVKHNKIIIH